MDDFQRHPTTGAPYVNHPTQVTKNGRPRRVLYGRPSNFGAQIEDRYGLTKWAERHVLMGLPQLDAEVLVAIASLDPEDDTERKILDTYVVDAKEAAGAFLAAKRGSHAHLIAQHLDNGEASPLSVIADGAELGIDANVADAVLGVWNKLCDDRGLEILAVEQTVVDDKWQRAGTLDRVARLTEPISFHGLTIPAGVVLILDIKTGRLRLEAEQPQFWHSYSIQIASYAHSVPYRIEGLKEWRDEWPWPISQRHGLIAHLDVGNAIEEGVAVASLWHVDLVAGLAAGNLARAARDWQNSNHLFRGQLDPPVAITVGDTPF